MFSTHSRKYAAFKSNQISRFATAPHHQSSGAPNIMTSNRDKTNILNKSKNKKEKRLRPKQGMWTI